MLDGASSDPGFGRRKGASQPPVGDAPNPLERLRPAATEPELERVLAGASGGAERLEAQRCHVAIDGRACPPGTQELDDLFEHAASVRSGYPQCRSFARLVEAPYEAEQHPAVGEHIELCERFGQEKGVPAERNEVGAELDAARPARS